MRHRWTVCAVLALLFVAAALAGPAGRGKSPAGSGGGRGGEAGGPLKKTGSGAAQPPPPSSPSSPPGPSRINKAAGQAGAKEDARATDEAALRSLVLDDMARGNGRGEQPVRGEQPARGEQAADDFPESIFGDESLLRGEGEPAEPAAGTGGDRPVGGDAEEEAGPSAPAEGSRGAGTGETESRRKETTQKANDLLNEADRLRYDSVSGEEVVSALPEVVRLYKEARDLGSGEAHSLLGDLELLGWGDGEHLPNATAAFEHFSEGAKLGWPDAHRNLGFMRAAGLGCAADQALSVLHYFFAASGGSFPAQMALGFRHLYGVGVPKVCEASVKYYGRLAEMVVKDLADESAPPLLLERHRLSDEKSRGGARDQDSDVVQFYEHSADNGDAGAQFAMGQLHYFGVGGVRRDMELAARYFRASASQGDAGSMARLGELYLRGTGVPQSDDDARLWFERSADAKAPAGITGLGYLYLHGRGVQRSYERALELFREAADEGHAGAQFNLGVMHFAGLGVGKSYSQALHHFATAGQLGHTRALYNMAQMHLNGLGAQENCASAIKLLKTVAERGQWSDSLEVMHRRYLRGDVEGSAVGYARMAEEGYEVAQSNSAWLLEDAGPAVLDPVGRKVDGARVAFRHLGMAADQGSVAAERQLGDCHYYGVGVPEANASVAAAYYRRAADKGDAQSLFNLGVMHEHGVGLPRDHFLSKRFYDEALERDPKAFVPVQMALLKLSLHGWLERTWPELLGLPSLPKQQQQQQPAHAPSSSPAAAGPAGSSGPSGGGGSGKDPSQPGHSKVGAGRTTAPSSANAGQGPASIGLAAWVARRVDAVLGWGRGLWAGLDLPAGWTTEDLVLAVATGLLVLVVLLRSRHH